MSRIIIRNGRVIDAASKTDQILAIECMNGRITRICDSLEPASDALEIDASNRWVVPGLVDMHVHLREPGREDEETIESGSRAAAAGGFTSIACMANTSPVNDNQAVTRFILDRASSADVHVYPIAAISRNLSGQELTDMGELVNAGVVAFSDDGVSVRNAEVLRRALEYSKMFSKTIIEHCEDLDLASGGVMNEGLVSTRIGLPGIPSIAEEIIISRDIQIAEFTGGKIHIAHVSTCKSVELIKIAKAKGINITAEATPHHLLLNDELVSSFDTNTKMNPPLRSEKDRLALMEALIDGTIDCIASDHAPHAVHEKDVEYNLAPNGIIGLETSLPLIMTRLVHTRKISPSRMVELMSLNPSQILGIPAGKIQQNAPADITIIDPEKYGIVDPLHFQSQSKNTPFTGWTLRGAAEKTIVNGKVVFSS